MSKRNILPIPEVLDVLNPFKVRKQRLMNFNPVTSNISRKDAECITITVFDYDGQHFEEVKVSAVEDVFKYLDTPQVSWVNIDGISKAAVHAICMRYGIHYLIEEDILSIGQRAKMDEIGDRLFCLLPMMYFNKESSIVEQEQVCIVLGKNFVISFQEDPRRDVFDPVRDRLRIQGSRLRMAGADYLCYSLIDIIVDNYFTVMERLGERIELMEDVIQHQPNTRALARINFLRRELAFFKRSVLPVRDLVNGFLKTESTLLDERTTKYFKDVYDHIVQASELIESYRDMMLNLQELYHTQLNVKMNEVMKVLAVVTTLMAPLTVIAGIYGMNFDNMPELHSPHGYFVTLGVMVVLFVLMIIVFKKRGWF